MRTVRVFPRRTRATPTDADAIVGYPGLWDHEVDEVRVSVTFTYDVPLAHQLADAWGRCAKYVHIGGPGVGTRGENFVPGEYVRRGYVITSRGCPNRCWFCSAWRRDGDIRELPICDGHNILDDNLLACSEAHIRAVFAMLRRQAEPAQFTGGLEAKRLREWHVQEFASMRIGQVFLAYDTPDDYEPIVTAAEMLSELWGFRSHKKRAYVLVGHPKDTFTAAEARLKQTAAIGIMPMAMLWRDDNGLVSPMWRKWARTWARPHIVGVKMRADVREWGECVIGEDENVATLEIYDDYRE